MAGEWSQGKTLHVSLSSLACWCPQYANHLPRSPMQPYASARYVPCISPTCTTSLYVKTRVYSETDKPHAITMQVFFCKYNDPLYVKMEKLEIMIKLASDKNIDQVLLEFKEYAQEVDVEFVRKVRDSVFVLFYGDP